MYSLLAEPIENKAVVASLLRRGGGSLVLEDTSHIIPLKRRPGLSEWYVMDEALKPSPQEPQVRREAGGKSRGARRG